MTHNENIPPSGSTFVRSHFGNSISSLGREWSQMSLSLYPRSARAPSGGVRLAERDAAPAAVPRRHGTGSPGAPPAGTTTGCQELARKEATSGLPRSAAPGLKTPRWSAARRGVSEEAPTTKMLRQAALHPLASTRGKPDRSLGRIPPRERSRLSEILPNAIAGLRFSRLRRRLARVRTNACTCALYGTGP